MQLRIIIADDHPVVLLGAKIIVEKGGSGLVVGQAENPEELEAILKSTPCDLLVTDFAMPNSRRDGLIMLKRLRRLHPELKIIVLTSIRNSSLILGILNLGIQGVVEKNADQFELIEAIKKVARHQRYISPFFREALADVSILNFDRPSVKLSPKELEVVRLLAIGLTQAQVAEKLSRSIKTISWTKVSAKTKLGIKTDAELYQYARNTHLST
ncbi:response regulator transcription factor [Pseudomonas savastanoi pv. phaseolicola]|uniref:DNA-binding response regulator, LuxR family n=3 Tax=Pseudomonas savastanoi TaxID=29438 RepID=Q48NF8_PSE14|nr:MULTISPECIES: response regulator transcription factor [Pseudomonas]AAZ35691.1 DNA-binding response regulator, LuxR family [Pseudomonas savastanoi pv. phaseolicola 1448A]KPY12827.1 DNA-binding response regulator, LuxR family [Pseudomonas savastanoi pv. phaseolicola]MBN4183850.1 Transcriptional regulatory protein RcsB [Pseudomonas savastanoi pv. phaseolicola]MDG6382298.1 response regulator transcription factor [Pseudomonas savastanoi pv. phaseolicola]MDG6392657.1 response regulator transcript